MMRFEAEFWFWIWILSFDSKFWFYVLILGFILNFAFEFWFWVLILCVDSECWFWVVIPSHLELEKFSSCFLSNKAWAIKNSSWPIEWHQKLQISMLIFQLCNLAARGCCQQSKIKIFNCSNFIIYLTPHIYISKFRIHLQTNAVIGYLRFRPKLKQSAKFRFWLRVQVSAGDYTVGRSRCLV